MLPEFSSRLREDFIKSMNPFLSQLKIHPGKHGFLSARPDWTVRLILLLSIDQSNLTIIYIMLGRMKTQKCFAI